MDDLIRHEQQINQQLARYGVKFGIYKTGRFTSGFSRSTPSRG